MSTQLSKIKHIIAICLQLDHVENFTKLGVSVRKKQAVNIVNTLNRYIHYMMKFMLMLFLKFICTNYKENIAYGAFYDKYFSGGRLP